MSEQQPKPMSVEVAKDTLMCRILDLYDGGHPASHATYYKPHIDNLIAAVRADQTAKVLAEFREYAQVGLAIGAKCHASDILAIIQSLETTNKTP